MEAEHAARPRLLYLLTSFNSGGAEWGLLELLDGGAFAGFDVTVAVLAKGAGAQLDALAARGISPVMLSQAERLTLAGLAVSAVRLRRLLRGGGWRAVVLSLPHANLLGRLLRPSRDPPVVLSFEHNSRLAKPIYEAAYRATATRVDWLLADCRATLDAALRCRFRRRPDHCQVLPLARFPPNRFETPTPPPRPGEPFHLVTAGRLTPVKDHARIIDMLAVMRQGGVAACLTIYGEGPLRAALEAQALRLGLSEAVSLPGRVPEWWRCPAHLFVLSSRHEGLCIAALEAMAAGLAVAVPPVGGLAEDGPAAHALMLGGDIATDAQRIVELLADPTRLAEMSRAGRRHALDQYGQEAVDRRYAEFNDQLGAERCVNK